MDMPRKSSELTTSLAIILLLAIYAAFTVYQFVSSFSKFHLFFLLFVLVLENKKGPRVGASLFVKRFGFLFFTLLIDYTVQNLENADL